MPLTVPAYSSQSYSGQTPLKFNCARSHAHCAEATRACSRPRAVAGFNLHRPHLQSLGTDCADYVARWPYDNDWTTAQAESAYYYETCTTHSNPVHTASRCMQGSVVDCGPRPPPSPPPPSPPPAAPPPPPVRPVATVGQISGLCASALTADECARLAAAEGGGDFQTVSSTAVPAEHCIRTVSTNAVFFNAAVSGGAAHSACGALQGFVLSLIHI